MTIKAMVLAAGFGKRLRPATLKRPKPLIPLLNRPILYHIFDLLWHFRIRDVIVNTHHLSDYFIPYLQFSPHRFISPAISHEERILGTGGGIKKVQDFFLEDFLVLNGDILFYFNLDDLIRFHQSRNAFATLALMKLNYAPRIEIAEDNRIISINHNNKTGLLTYIGIQIINRRIFDYITSDAFVDIMDVYRDLIKSGKEMILGYVTNPTYWWDMGTIDMYLEATGYLLCNYYLLKPHLLDNGIGRLTYPCGSRIPLLLGEGSILEDGVEIKKWAVVGRNCTIKKGACIQRSVLWDNVTVEEDTILMDTVVTDDTMVEGQHTKKVI